LVLITDAIGTIWGSLVLGISRNPSLKDELYKAAVIGSSIVLAGDKPGQIAEKFAIISSEIEHIEFTLDDSDGDL